MPLGWAIAGSAVLGFFGSRSATNAAERSASAATQASQEAARLQYDLGKDVLEFQKQYYNDVLKPSVDSDRGLRTKLIDDYLLSSGQQRDIAQKQFDYYEREFKPVEQQMLREAQNYDSAENVNRRMGIASAAVNQGFSNAAGQQARLLSRYGINPNSSSFARTSENLARSQALGDAGAQTGAAFDTMDRGIALRAGAANFGRNMPNTAAAFYAGGDRSGTAAGSTSAQGIQNAVSAMSPMLQGSGIAAGAFNSAGNLNNDVFRNQMAMYNSQMQGVGGLFQGVGSLAGTRAGQAGLTNMFNTVGGWFRPSGFMNEAGGMELAGSLGFADGGHVGDGAVHGPGGPRDDMVPAMLSKGEFVMNEGAVKHFGIAKLNKMNEVGLQNQEARGLIRRS